MTDTERVIKAWTIFRDSNPYEICHGREFRAIREPEYCMGQMIEDTIELLKDQDEINDHYQSLLIAYNDMRKEQEPRVLTADELYLMEHKCVYLERRNSKVYSTEPSIVIGTSKPLDQYKYLLMRENKISDVRYSSDYNKETKSGWRCWSAKPTEERRKEVNWE